ncbi:uncharacterized protein LOC111196604 isoform X2 [Astyanax mexicanus]|uniref:uncharacterized protein LOC111196604 isoform X2 n=1 Tax=Astyanax mexicanus TaxID=7994 RepID=UPI0020CB1467|nr:uncharacterized protein LOC111196604 isoform X2 [Astyanax mexicanus]
MEDFWVKSIEQSLRKERDGRVERQIHVLKGETHEDFMRTYVDVLHLQGRGYFISRKSRSPNLIQWKCERGNKASGASSGNPEKTRANSCPAYVSFQFVTDNNISGCIVRVLAEHSGHDISNSQEDGVNRVDEDLLNYIHECLSQGLSNSEILLRTVRWFRTYGKNDLRDRRYFLTQKDITGIRAGFNARQRFDRNDSISVDRLIKADLQDSILYYQPLSHKEHQPLIIVFSSQWQQEQCKQFGSSMIFVDATYKGVTQYGFAFYAVLVKTSEGKGVPVAFFVMSEESTSNIEICLRKLQEAANLFTPRCVMVDKDIKEINAIKAVFPHSAVLLCWFHVLQAEEFQKMSEDLLARIETETQSTQVCDYLRKNWLTNAEMWSNFGRLFYHHQSETNNVVERFFLGLKYGFFCGYSNKRVDDLLRLLNDDVVPYYKHLGDLQAAGRTNSKSPQDVSEAAQRMKSNGLGQSVTYNSEGQFSIPSETIPGHVYSVNLVYMTCDCKYALKGNVCKHLEFAKMISAENGTEVEDIRQRVANALWTAQDYTVHMNSVIVDSGTQLGIVNMETEKCSCLTSSLGEACVCLKVLWNLTQKAHTEESNPPEISKPNDHTYSMANQAQTLQPNSSKWCIKKLVTDLNEWCNSTDYKPSLDMFSAVKHAHHIMFGKYTRICRKRKIERLHPYRKSIELSRKRALNVHNYQLAKPGKRLLYTSRPDSTFQKKRGKPSSNRAKSMRDVYTKD